MGLAPWNHEQYEIKSINNKFYVDEYQLIFYHFHQFNIDLDGRISFSSLLYQSKKSLPLDIYLTYIYHLSELGSQLSIQKLGLPDPNVWKIIKIPKYRLMVSRFLFNIFKRNSNNFFSLKYVIQS
jgi:hypothetical protein